VFTDTAGNVIRPARATEVFRRLIPALPIRRIRLHDSTFDIRTLCCCRPACPWSTSATGHSNPAMTLELYAHALQQPGHVLAETVDRLLDDPWRPGDLINSRRRDEPTADLNPDGPVRLSR
jgi:hypothetical protein